MSKPRKVLFEEYYSGMTTLEAHVVDCKNTLSYLVIKSLYTHKYDGKNRYALTVVRWDPVADVPEMDLLDEPVLHKKMNDAAEVDALYDKLCFDLESYITPFKDKRKEV